MPCIAHISGLPCKHVMPCIAQIRGTYKKYVALCFPKDAYLRCYPGIIHPLPENLNDHILRLIKYYPQLFKDHLVGLRHAEEGRLMNH